MDTPLSDKFQVDATKVSDDDAPAADLIRALVHDNTVPKGMCMIFYTDKVPGNTSSPARLPLRPVDRRDSSRDGKAALLYIYNDGCYKLRFSETTMDEEKDTSEPSVHRGTVERVLSTACGSSYAERLL